MMYERDCDNDMQYVGLVYLMQPAEISIAALHLLSRFNVLLSSNTMS